MKILTYNILLLVIGFQTSIHCQKADRIIARQGQVSFFSYTSVEDIEATNNQVFSLLDKTTGDIAVNMLMRAFVFKKALMEEHFNESYIESDLYPKMEFFGKIQDYNPQNFAQGTHIVKGTMELHGVKKEIELKVKVDEDQENMVLTGDLEIAVSDFQIKVPPLLAPNIAKIIQVMFRFEYRPYE